MPSTGLTFSSDEKTATVQMTNVPIIDQPRWPAMDAETTPAFMDFKLVLKLTDEPVKYEDPTRQYRFEGFKAAAQLEATIRVPSIDFIFKTDPMDKQRKAEAYSKEIGKSVTARDREGRKTVDIWTLP